MSDPNDPNPSLRAELNAALAVIAPQIRGLADTQMIVTLSPGLQEQIGGALADHRRRHDLIEAALAALDAVVAALVRLKADGYPVLDPIPILPDLFNEFTEELANLESAFAQFLLGRQETGDFDPQSATLTGK